MVQWWSVQNHPKNSSYKRLFEGTPVEPLNQSSSLRSPSLQPCNRFTAGTLDYHRRLHTRMIGKLQLGVSKVSLLSFKLFFILIKSHFIRCHFIFRFISFLALARDCHCPSLGFHTQAQRLCCQCHAMLAQCITAKITRRSPRAPYRASIGPICCGNTIQYWELQTKGVLLLNRCIDTYLHATQKLPKDAKIFRNCSIVWMLQTISR